MAEIDYPGVYIEEIPVGPRPIEGVPTSTAGFVGPAHAGPTSGRPVAVGSLVEFERTFGDGQPLSFTNGTSPNYLWHAVRAFFVEGGRRCYIGRVSRGDGARPTATDYAGDDCEAADHPTLASGLRAMEAVDDASIVAAPGSTAGCETDDARRADATAVHRALIAHAEMMRDRIALLDCGDAQDLPAVRAMRARVDSSYAAFHYPWLRTHDGAGGELLVPPSGCVAGIYARNDLERGVHHSPANEVVRSAVAAEVAVGRAEQERLNPEGINCFRTFPGRGLRLWGARTTSSDPEWRYVGVRRHILYLERSIDRGLHWTVFEPNGEPLWDRVRASVNGFLLAAWRSGSLQGNRAEQAFFVRCDRTTMTQDDVDNGRLICQVGVAVVRPAEFVIVRIGAWSQRPSPDPAPTPDPAPAPGPPARFDGFAFLIILDRIDAAPSGGFQEVTGLAPNEGSCDAREDRAAPHVRKLPGRRRVVQVTLKRGLTDATELRAWYDAAQAGPRGARRTIFLTRLDERRQPVSHWRLDAAWPVKWEGPALNATANDIAIESIELTCERVSLVDASGCDPSA